MSEKKEKKTEKTKEKKPMNSTVKFFIFAAILIIIFLGLVAIPNYINKTKFENNKYNSFEFYKGGDDFWYTVVQKADQTYQIPFYYHPSELEDIPVEIGLRSKFFEIAENNGTIFVTFDPNYNNTVIIAGVEISRITGSRYELLNVPTRSAFIKQPTDALTETGTPVVTCMHANNQTLVVWMTLSNLNIASSQGYCIILEAKSDEDMIRVADRTMYHLLGIMS